MRNLIFIVSFMSAFFVSGHSFAAAQSVFGSDKGMIVIQGAKSDADAATLWSLVNVPPTETPSGLKKVTSFSSGTPAKTVLTIICTLSETVENLGSCTIVVPDSQFATLNKASRIITLTADRELASRIGMSFISQTGDTLFSSTDGRLAIHRSNDAAGKTTAFRIVYHE